MTIDAWLDPSGCPPDRPPVREMSAATRELHDALDARARATGVGWLHPERRTIQRDLLGSPEVVAWQEAKAGFVLAGDGAWSELPHLYARYGTPGTAALIGELRRLEQASCAVVTDCGMQACALVIDAVMSPPNPHAVIMRQVYNKTRTYADHVAKRLGGGATLVDDGDLAGLASAITPSTRLVFAETYTNPLMRAQDIAALRAIVDASPAPRAHLVIDTTIATPWGLVRPALAGGASIVVGSLTKALGGQDLALGGYVATNDAEVGNALMDLVAMRGGILDDERAQHVVEGLARAERAHAWRCATATRVATFLASHPRVERVFHPSRPDHPDAAAIARDYARHGSIVSLRVRGADERQHRHLADVLVSCVVPRYALSFDGLATKVNHHRTVSEYFTPPDQIARLGIDRLIRLGIGIEDAGDLIACLNWTLHHASEITPEGLDAWRRSRAAELGLTDR